ncbi:hypothetical protein E3P94_03328 [Wallemia ichthyophaga]|nr:hypothetical protein E3P95_03269 [Wallemia ichthyophaga]TIA97436.1 hypothetical protein E3P94_03328 [Wallemia ichthyophaga]
MFLKNTETLPLRSYSNEPRRLTWLNTAIRWLLGATIGAFILGAAFKTHVTVPNLLKPKVSRQDILQGGIAQYSPQYDVDWGVPDQLPQSCTIDMVTILERHGARFPDHKPRNEMVATIDKLHNAKRPAKHSKLNFVSHYDIRQTLGEEDLVWMGRQQAYNSGKRFFDQYKDLIDNSFPPFYRAPSSPRVIESAQLFQLGFNDDPIWKAYDDLDVILPEGKAHNNTLDISNCPLASNHSTTIGDDVSDVYASLWTPHWAKWWNDNFPGAKLEHKDIVNLFHTCAFDTVVNNGYISEWCKMYSLEDFHHYSYYLILQKYYDSSYGHPLGRARGIGYVNELISRLTGEPVVDSTSTNQTLDADPATFPIPPKDRNQMGHKVFVDFSHDSSMVNIISALGLAKPPGLRHLPFLIDRREPTPNYLFDISKYTPFSGRITFEKIHCGESIGEYDAEEDYVRIKMNEGVYPLKFSNCGPLGQEKGLCRLSDFIESQRWSMEGGNCGVVLEKVCEYLLFKQRYESVDNKETVPDFQERIPPEIALELLVAADYLQTPISSGLSKSQLLSKWRDEHGLNNTSSIDILRDTVNILQGIDGTFFRFQGTANQSEFKLIPTGQRSKRVPKPTLELVIRLAELGWLYKQVAEFVHECSTSTSKGLITQALSRHVQNRLYDFYRLIALLEAQLAHTPEKDDDHSDSTDSLTLGRISVWTEEWRLKMRMMSTLVQGAEDVHGGALVSLIHGYTENGDPFIRAFVSELLEEVSQPFFNTLHTWITSGELYDPFKEFFVSNNNDLGMDLNSFGWMVGAANTAEHKANIDAGQLWAKKYSVRDEMRPRFVGEAFAKKIFSIGKSLNFIRHSCMDEEFFATNQISDIANKVLTYSDIPSLEQSIDIAFSIASQRLLENMFSKYKLMDHLQALKRYLMLGSGDFVDILMESIGPSLARPANTLYRHNLTATLEAAIRGSNAQYDDQEMLRRLDARMLEYTHGEIGWDVFTLEYRVDQPLDVILTPEVMSKYRRIFNYLWRLKRVESDLVKGWKRCVMGKRSYLKVPSLDNDWHQARLAMSEMIHFVKELEAYCHLEVIECSWERMEQFASKREGDLDALIAAHRDYLERIVSKIMLVGGRSSRRDEELMQKTKQLLNVILTFRRAVEDLYTFTLHMSSSLDHTPIDNANNNYRNKRLSTASSISRAPFEVAGGGSSSSMTGSRTSTPGAASVVDEDDDSIAGIRTRVQSSAEEFHELATYVVNALQSHPDLDVRFLAVRLGFNQFYRKPTK